jgi:hypothetical protein
MRKMHRIAFFAILSAAAFAQTEVQPPEKPPAGLEQAVRARVSQFYEMLVNQQYRKAEGMVAEDTKDYYYAGSKPEIHKFEVLSVAFSDRFTHAKVLTRCSEPIVLAGFPPTEITVNVPTLWKLENGDWYVYEDPEKITNPTGLRTKMQSAVDGASSKVTVPQMPQMPHEQPTDSSFVLGKLHLDKPEIRLAPGLVETVTVGNYSAGPVTLELGYPSPGIDAKLDRTELDKGDKAILTLTAGKEPHGGFFYLRVIPTGEVLRIQVQTP